MAETSPTNQVIAILAAMASERNDSYRYAEKLVVKFHDSRFSPIETLTRLQAASILPKETIPESEESASNKLQEIGVEILQKQKSFPPLESFIISVLQCLGDGKSKEVSREKTSQLSEEVADMMLMPSSLRDEKIAKANAPKYVSQTYWACHKLESIGMLKRTDDDTVAITENGEAFLSDLIEDINKESLTKRAMEPLAPPKAEQSSPKAPPPKNTPKPYNITDLRKDLFIEHETLEAIGTTLGEDRKNLILCGPPGVGKTYAATRIAYALMGAEDEDRVQLVQFHQAYSYEDFIQGIRPAAQGQFIVKPGAFFDFCEKARNDQERSYFFIIDEINRGNLSKILGESMMLIERDKRKARYAIRLTYQDKDDPRFFVPDNIYIIGMMNTADRSLALVDYALRRRFSFIDLTPGFRHINFKSQLIEANISEVEYTNLVNAIEWLNTAIAADPSLGSGFKIGHSYFCSKPKNTPAATWLEKIARFEIRPMLLEYWFDEPEKAQDNFAGFCNKLGLKISL